VKKIIHEKNCCFPILLPVKRRLHPSLKCTKRLRCTFSRRIGCQTIVITWKWRNNFCNEWHNVDNSFLVSIVCSQQFQSRIEYCFVVKRSATLHTIKNTQLHKVTNICLIGLISATSLSIHKYITSWRHSHWSFPIWWLFHVWTKRCTWWCQF
jgi:hypothetical protein